MMIFPTEDEIKAALIYLESHDRNGKPYMWPESHHFGRLERDIDNLLYQLGQYPPFTWAEFIVEEVSYMLKFAKIN